MKGDLSRTPRHEDSNLNATNCDRRLSRAARTILRKHLVKLVGLTGDEKETVTVWDLLNRILPPDVSKNSIGACELDPSRDMYRADEEHIHNVPPKFNFKAYPSSTLKTRRKTSPRRPETWYKCASCGRVFATRFYLDLHMKKCQNLRSDQDEINYICPAKSWCQFLGGEAVCAEVALQLEPHYDRGSGGWGQDHSFVYHKLAKQAHAIPCNSETLAQSRQACHAMLNSCGLQVDDENSVDGGIPGSLVHRRICNSLQCPDRLLNHLLGGMHPESWMEEWHLVWSQETEHRQLGIVGLVIAIALFLWFVPLLFPSFVSWSARSRRRRDSAGQRLLHKSAGRKRPWLSSLPWSTSPSLSSTIQRKRRQGKLE